MSVFSNFSNLFAKNHGAGNKLLDRADRGVPIRDYTGQDIQIASALTAIYTKSVQTRRDFLLEFERIKSFYIIQALLTALVEDALTPDITTGEILQIVSTNEKINQELKLLQQVFNFDQIINDLVMDMISYGEYTLRLKVVKDQGVVDIVDDLDQSRIVAFYHQGYPYRFIRQTDRDIEVYPAYKFCHFVYGQNRLRVKIENEFVEIGNYVDEYGFIYPSYARVGRPLMYGTLAKIKELMVLEQLIPASKLNQLLTGSLVGLQVPTSMSPDEGFKAARRYEQILNRHRGTDRGTGELTIVDIISVAGKIRVLPQFGDKGQLQNINEVKENRTVDDLMGTIRDIREVICGSLGFPPEILFGGEGGPKAEFLKRYSRYLRKLKNVQKAISSGLIQICLAHLANKGIKDVKIDDIQVIFRNELVNIDELEKLEFSDAIIQMVANIHRFMEEVKQGSFNNIIDEAGYQAWLYKAFSILGRDSNFIRPPEGYKERGNEIEVM
jgi:hypothetical protein